jgi:nucleoid DNA-binding protein
MNRDEFVRLVAQETNFSIQDIKLVMNAIVKVFEEAILNRVEINIRGLGKLSYTTLPARRVSKIISENGGVFPEATRMNFSLAQNLKRLVKKK